MAEAAGFRILREGAAAVLSLSGDWTATRLGRAGARLAVEARGAGRLRLDIGALQRFDTAGANALLRVGVIAEGSDLASRPDVIAMLDLTAGVGRPVGEPPPDEPGGLYGLLVRLGRGAEVAAREVYLNLAFYGRLLSALGRLIARPSRFRVAPTVAQMERAGLDAMPIVATLTFFVGATIAFLGEELLTQFGAKIFSVELVGIGVLREFAVLVTAIILAGRSASSFAAEIGAMRMNQEVDAMQVMGVDPFEALVAPRFLALLTMTPLLTFVAMIAGLFGGLIVVWTVAGLSPAFFLQRLLDNVGVSQFYLGMVKAPVLAMVIAAIGCRHGMEVGGDVESLGRRVTAAVVEALFAIIVIDALFALLFMEMGQ